jgi:hypothetical protein
MPGPVYSIGFLIQETDDFNEPRAVKNIDDVAEVV